MITPQLSFSRSVFGDVVLRADAVRRDTLTQLVQGWADPDVRDRVIAALDELAEVVQSPRSEGELDDAVDSVELDAGMEPAEVRMRPQAARPLLDDLSAVLDALTVTPPEPVRSEADAA